ncbi:hypothetical protein ACQKLP_03020 [Chitinophaga sp. NPDC101104]|uniref:hypothetical protein n=1 Tax=Chitinophaga sp. NPDC101104 TaxID=3390561 RepID=UPI003D021FC4
MEKVTYGRWPLAGATGFFYVHRVILDDGQMDGEGWISGGWANGLTCISQTSKLLIINMLMLHCRKKTMAE